MPTGPGHPDSALVQLPGPGVRPLSPFHPDECSLTAASLRVLEGSIPPPGRKQKGILADIHCEELEELPQCGDPGRGPWSLHPVDGSTCTPLQVSCSPGSLPSPAAGVGLGFLCAEL